MQPLLRGHPDERPPPLERPLDNVNLNIYVLISTPDERPPILKDHISGAKGMALQEGFQCIYIHIYLSLSLYLSISIYLSIYLYLSVSLYIYVCAHVTFANVGVAT